MTVRVTFCPTGFTDADRSAAWESNEVEKALSSMFQLLHGQRIERLLIGNKHVGIMIEEITCGECNFWSGRTATDDDAECWADNEPAKPDDHCHIKRGTDRFPEVDPSGDTP